MLIVANTNQATKLEIEQKLHKIVSFVLTLTLLIFSLIMVCDHSDYSINNFLCDIIVISRRNYNTTKTLKKFHNDITHHRSKRKKKKKYQKKPTTRKRKYLKIIIHHQNDIVSLSSILLNIITMCCLLVFSPSLFFLCVFIVFIGIIAIFSISLFRNITKYKLLNKHVIL